MIFQGRPLGCFREDRLMAGEGKSCTFKIDIARHTENRSNGRDCSRQDKLETNIK